MSTLLIVLIVISATQTSFIFFHMIETMNLRDDLENLRLRFTARSM